MSLQLEIGVGSDTSISKLSKKYFDSEKTTVLVDFRRQRDVLDQKEDQTFVQARAEELPFADKSVDLIYSRDFFGAEGLLTGEDFIETERIGDIDNIIGEMNRVLITGGKVVILEYAGGVSKITPEELMRKFTDAGFEVSPENFYPEEQMSQLIEKYRNVDSEVFRGSYFEGSYGLVVTKKH